jgi:predicted kinase
MGNSVILDASFSKKQYRDMVKEKLKEKDIPIFFIETDSPKKTIMKRLFE